MLHILFYTVFLCIGSLHGADFFESILVRLQCYKTTQEGCDTDLIEAYPEVSKSVTNLTNATTHFYLFTPENRDEPELMHKCAGNTPPNSKFNPKLKTEIFLPGFVSGVCNFAIYRELKNERLKSGCFNVILVDWMWGNIFDLEVAKQNMKIVVKHIVIVIRNLKEKYGLTAADFILTGHSYGAHMAGLVGQEEEIGRIIGIDPAGVLFTENTPLDERLDAGDAKLVEVLHCNAGQCLPGYFAVNFSCGDKDYYINGGLEQRSCNLQTMKAFAKGDYIYALFSLYHPACQHFQCLQYYRASMLQSNGDQCLFVGIKCSNNTAFQAGECRNCGENGENCSFMASLECESSVNDGENENYYLNTDLHCPYCDNSDLDLGGLKCNRTCPPRK